MRAVGLLFLFCFLATLSYANYLEYSNGVISFGNDSLLVFTCMRERCEPGFVNVQIIDDTNPNNSFWINSSGRPMLDAMVDIETLYALPSNEECLVKFSSPVPFQIIQQDNKTNMLFSNGVAHYVISKQVTYGAPYEVYEEEGSICIRALNKSGTIKIYLENTGPNNPVDYYLARLYQTEVVVEFNTSSIEVTKGIVPYVLDVGSLSFSKPTISPKIEFSNCTNMTFYYESSLGNKTREECTFEDQVLVSYEDYLLAPFDYYSAEIKTNTSLASVSAPITVLPSDEYRGTISVENNKITLNVFRSDETKFGYLVFLVIGVFLLLFSWFKTKRDKYLKTFLATVPIILQLTVMGGYLFALPSLILIVVSLALAIHYFLAIKTK